MEKRHMKTGYKHMAKAIAVIAILGIVAEATAEGSRDLFPSGYGGAGAGRANLNLNNLSTQRYLDIIPSRTFLYVYAEAGEYILLGSRNRTAAGVGSIEVFNPPAGQSATDLGFGIPGDETAPASADFTCTSGTQGLIASRAAELAGPNSADGSATVANGFTPCAYQAPSSGVYAVLFSGSSGTTVNASIETPTTHSSSVSVWDVTVRANASSLTNINGRLFTYAFAGTTGGNGDGRRLYNSLYYLTDDGYLYQQIQRGMDPNVFALYSNPQGFLDQGEPLYKNIRSSGHYLTGGIRPTGTGIVVQRPQYPIFFTNPVTADGFAATRDYLGIPVTPPAPDISNISFTYLPTQGSTTYVGRGGIFSFDAVDAISYQIVISRDGVDYDPAKPDNRVLSGSVNDGLNQVLWNGLDNSGNPFPAANFEFQATVRNGEVHFPFVDVENNLSGGPTVIKLNGPNAGDATVYFDDRGYVTRNGTAVGTLNGDICGLGYTNQPTPSFSLTGVDSSDADLNGPGSYYRSWDGSSNTGTDCSGNNQYFGDAKGMDLWAFEKSEPSPGLVLNFAIIDFSDVTTSLSVSQAVAAGSQATAVIEYSNVGSQDADGVTYSLELPAGLSGVTCTGATCSYNPGTGTITVTGLPSSLSPGQSSSVILNWIAPEAEVEVLSFINTSTDQGPNLAPDSSQGSTQNNPEPTNNTDVLTQISAPLAATPGSTVGITVNYLNLGPLIAENMVYTVNLPAGLTGVSCPAATVTCSYNAATGIVTISGLTDSLAPASSVSVDLLYTAPTSGTVTVSSVISTSTSEIIFLNNTATASTNIINSTVADVTTSVAPPPVANAGSLVNVPVVFRNLGPQAAADIGYSLSLTPGLSDVSCVGATCVYDPVTGEVTLSGLPPALSNGQSSAFTLVYRAPASGNVQVISTINTSSSESNSANNSASSQTAIAAVDLFATVDSSSVVPINGSASFTVTFGNQGEAPAPDVVYSVQLPPGLNGVSCTDATCTYDPATGILTLEDMPLTIQPGQQVSVEINVLTSGFTGQLTLNAGVSTSAPEENLINNSNQISLMSAHTTSIPSLSSLGTMLLTLSMGWLVWRRRKLLFK